MPRNSDKGVPQNPEDYPILILRLLQPELSKYRSGRERKCESIHERQMASLSHTGSEENYTCP